MTAPGLGCPSHVRSRTRFSCRNHSVPMVCPNALRVFVVICVAAGALDEPAVSCVAITLLGPRNVLGLSFLPIFQVPISHPSHVGIAMESRESIPSPLLVHQILKLVAIVGPMYSA